MDEDKSWTEILQGIAKNGVSEAVDRFIGPDSAYEQDVVAMPMQGQGSQDAAYRPVDNTPGEPTGGMVQGFSNQQLAIGGVGLVIALGLVVYLARS